METLTDAELDLVRKSCESGVAGDRRLRVSSVACVVGGIGAVGILLGSGLQLVSGEIGWDELWNAAGFVLVLIGFFGVQWDAARSAALARSVIAKLWGDASRGAAALHT